MSEVVLASLRCRSLEGHAAMGASDVAHHLTLVDGWASKDGAIEKAFSFDDYHRTLAFINALAWIAHREDHHPDVAFSYNRATVRFNTHSVGGISINDFICAAKVDALLA
jgi:4a-hydroxytetrahydrobiopterin dehydratase